ncbi:sulfite exporter TauE/SafE family protein [Endozoicomonas arenosclerae]|uniref:sulfite exporter TauE/SafE family protein n=1 Tax=Endozoicomonas arenosclerae TaxID=1633495 RepID=UPI000B1D6E9E|nr:sulfite exporter TauE/SafE family protein [Endozoicomonas arenosclerae]
MYPEFAMPEYSTLLIIITAFLITGSVKGITGLGLPTVSLALLTVTVGLPSAMALLLVPSLVTNLLQAFSGGYFKAIIKRLWPFFLCAGLAVLPGSLALSRVDPAWLSMVLGVLLIIYSGLSLTGKRLVLEPVAESRWGVFLGIINGLLTGMTGSFVVPGVMYLQSVQLSRDALVQAMGILFSLSTLALALALQQNSLLSTEQGTLSLVALIPALVGMLLGQKIRRHLSEERFRLVLYIALLLLGLYIILSSLKALI